MAERERVTKKRVTGQLIQWKGKYGWIRPSERIQHAAASKRGGKVYLAMEDIDGPEIQVKSMVSFFVYADETGLGAMHCKCAVGAMQPKGDLGVKAGHKNIMKQRTGNSVAAKGSARGAAITGRTVFGGKAGGTAVSRGVVGKAGPPAQSKASKGKGPGNAKARGKGAEVKEEVDERPPPPPPDQGARERILAKRVTGKLIRWRGQMGWIKPTEKIDHPEAERHRKGIYLHEVDVKPGHELHQGAQVTFFVYSDEDGLGAEQCMLSKEPVPAPAEKFGFKAKLQTGVKALGKGKGAGASSQRTTMVQKMKLKRRRRGKLGKGSVEKTKGGPDLPRERVTTIPVTGEVIEWKGKFGWLSCSEEIEHEKTSKHEGKIYLHEKDILAGAPLSAGQPVEFHIYADSSGLGAEEVIATTS